MEVPLSSVLFTVAAKPPGIAAQSNGIPTAVIAIRNAVTPQFAGCVNLHDP